MKEFLALREAARVRRDKIIKQATQEYEDTIHAIAALADDLLGAEPNRRTTAEAVNSLVPEDGTFTTGDIMDALEKSEPGRIWNERAVGNQLSRLRDKGIIKRIRRAKRTERAVYVRVGVEYEKGRFDDMTLRQVIAVVLTEQGPLKVTELTIAVLEGGYDTIMNRKSFRRAVDTELKAHKQFARDSDGKWSLVK